MKYPVRAYARALAEAAAGTLSPAEEKKIISNFLGLVRRNGDTHGLPQMLSAAGKLLREKDGRRKVVIESARPFAGLSARFRGLLRKTDEVEERLEPALIAGVRITVDDEMRFDGGLRRKIDLLFRNDRSA